MAAVSAKTKRELVLLLKPQGGTQPRSPKIVPVERVLAVNDHAKQHGLYEADGNRGTINRGGTPIARWAREGQLSETQAAAIHRCLFLWERAGRHTGLVQDLLKVIGQQPSSGWAQQEALDELMALKSVVPRNAWEVFENVVRFDQPAGTAGSSLANNRRSAIDAARIAVCFVADMLAIRWRL
jgi:hypothetical protein